MPAVTVPDWTVLPRTVAARPDAEDRAAISVTTAPQGYEGEGFPVRRAFAGVDPRHLDPFIHMDQMGEVEYAPGEPKGTPWHPHRGFETVTYMIDGVFDHQDSHGGGGSITDGDTQWMTAGSGLLHIEARRSGWSPRAACSTASSCGSTCPAAPSGCRRTTRTSARTTSVSAPRTTRARSSASLPVRSTASRARAAPTRR